MITELNTKLESLYANYWPNLVKALLDYDPLNKNISNYVVRDLIRRF
jgi:hypothetical protein